MPQTPNFSTVPGAGLAQQQQAIDQERRMRERARREAVLQMLMSQIGQATNSPVPGLAYSFSQLR